MFSTCIADFAPKKILGIPQEAKPVRETVRVSALTLTRFRRSGTIPTEIGALTGLTGLSLRDNQLSG